jgi:Putative transposase
MGENTIRLHLKTAWRDGTESLLFTPSEFIEKLIALAPIPRFHLTRYDGVLASRSRHRRTLPDLLQTKDAQVSPASPPPKGKDMRKKGGRKRLTAASLLKRTFKIDILTCGRCGVELSLAVAGELRLTRRAFPL